MVFYCIFDSLDAIMPLSVFIFRNEFEFSEASAFCDDLDFYVVEINHFFFGNPAFGCLCLQSYEESRICSFFFEVSGFHYHNLIF